MFVANSNSNCVDLSDDHLALEQHLLLEQPLHAERQGLRGLLVVGGQPVEDEVVPLVLLEVVHLLIHLSHARRERVQQALKQ